MSRIFNTPEELLPAVGEELGVSDWLTIEQGRIQLFADATGDHQWIHVDEERAKAGPFGVCIAHGYLTLSLVNFFMPQIMEVRGIAMGINYGVDRVRFPAPVPVGSRVRGSALLMEGERLGEQIQVKVRMKVEIEGSERPACVADTISRFLPAQTSG